VLILASLPGLLVLIVLGSFDWRSIETRTPLHLAGVQVMLLAAALGVLIMRAAADGARFRYRAAVGLPNPPMAAPFWNGLVACALVIGMLFVAFWGRDALNTLAGTPAEVWSEFHQIVWCGVLGLLIGLFSHYHWRMRKWLHYETLLQQYQEITKTKLTPDAPSDTQTSGAVGAQKGRIPASEELWGKPRSPTKGSVPEVTQKRATTEKEAPLNKQKSNEASWTLGSGERVLVENIAVDVTLRYRNWEADERDRRVTVQAVIGKRHLDGEVTISRIGGWCHLRRATREFRVQSIIYAADPATGEIIPTLGDWLMRKVGRSETVRPLDPARTEGPNAREVEPTIVDLQLDLSRGRGQAVEQFTVEIYSVAGQGHAFEGMATRHRAPGVHGWKGRKRFLVQPDGPVRLSWLRHQEKIVDDVSTWLASLPDASVTTRTPPPGRISAKPL
jgi:hypothetical protein